MIRRIIKLSITFISIVLLNVSCGSDVLVSNNPPSPVNIEDAIIFNPDLKYGTVIDIDGNIYKTIKIGEKTWMAENLRVTRFRNGDIIPTIYSASTWEKINEWGALGLCAYNNDYSKESIAKHGLLYGDLVWRDVRNVAPLGWHVADRGEWLDLLDSVPIETLIGVEWENYEMISEVDKAIINKAGLTILPSGYRDRSGSYQERGYLFCNNCAGHFEYSLHFRYFECLWSACWNWAEATSLRCVKD